MLPLKTDLSAPGPGHSAILVYLSEGRMYRFVLCNCSPQLLAVRTNRHQQNLKPIIMFIMLACFTLISCWNKKLGKVHIIMHFNSDYKCLHISC